MTTIRTAMAAAALAPVLAAVLAGCSVGGTGTATPAGPATSGAATATGSVTPSAVAPSGGGAVGPDELAVQDTLLRYQGALAGADFATACSLYTADASMQLLVAVQADGGQVLTCEDALTAVFGQAGVPVAAAEAANTMTVDDVVIRGLSATVTWSSTRQGEPRTDTAILQFVDGRWLLAGAA